MHSVDALPNPNRRLHWTTLVEAPALEEIVLDLDATWTRSIAKLSEKAGSFTVTTAKITCHFQIGDLSRARC